MRVRRVGSKKAYSRKDRDSNKKVDPKFGEEDFNC